MLNWTGMFPSLHGSLFINGGIFRLFTHNVCIIQRDQRQI